MHFFNPKFIPKGLIQHAKAHGIAPGAMHTHTLSSSSQVKMTGEGDTYLHPNLWVDASDAA